MCWSDSPRSAALPRSNFPFAPPPFPSTPTGALPTLTEEPDAPPEYALPGAVLPQNLRYNEHGQLLPPLPGLPQQPQFDTNGNILLPPPGVQPYLNASGEFVLPPQQYGADGQPLQYGPGGQLLQYGVDGQPLQFGADGQPLQYGADGQLLLQVPPGQQGQGVQMTQGVWMQVRRPG